MTHLLHKSFRPVLHGINAALTGGLLVASAFQPARAEDAALFEAVRTADMRVARIGWSLAIANAALCDRIEAGTGMQLHVLDQYGGPQREAAARHFGFTTPVAVEGVLPGSPAEQAGLRADDSLVRVGSVEIAKLSGKAGKADRLDAAHLAIAALPVDAPIEVDALRAGRPIHVTIRPIRACNSRFEMTDDFNAASTGTAVQVGTGFLEDYPDEQIAVVVAHEFAHNILRHRDRLIARGVDYGLLSGFGANVKYFRQTEVQADLLSVYLLANAGYPLRATTAFWKRFGPSKAGGILRSRSHPAWRDRVATFEAEIAKAETISARPLVPPILGERDKPLDGDWQSILVRSR